jgi:uracil-DNA glycosylase
MDDIETLLARSGVNQQWRDILRKSLAKVSPEYLDQLLADDSWLPGIDNLFSAFRRNFQDMRYLLIGESPYPRKASANGISFYDAAVTNLWSDQGLSKQVNRATSMRNIMKTALIAEKHLVKDKHGKITQQAIASVGKNSLIQTMPELFDKLHRAGFLMLNATPVLHPTRKPAQEAVHWQGFLESVLGLIADNASQAITILLWGKIAGRLEMMNCCQNFEKIVCEHPYNISFIDNPDMQRLFNKIRILQA